MSDGSVAFVFPDCDRNPWEWDAVLVTKSFASAECLLFKNLQRTIEQGDEVNSSVWAKPSVSNHFCHFHSFLSRSSMIFHDRAHVCHFFISFSSQSHFVLSNCLCKPGLRWKNEHMCHFFISLQGNLQHKTGLLTCQK